MTDIASQAQIDYASSFDPHKPSNWKERVYPFDDRDVRNLVYLLIDISAGRLATREPIRILVASFMAEIARADVEYSDEDLGARENEVVDRLLTIPTGYIHGDAVAEIALVIIRAYPAWPSMVVSHWGWRLNPDSPATIQSRPYATLGPANCISIVYGEDAHWQELKSRLGIVVEDESDANGALANG